MIEELRRMFDKYIPKILEFKKASGCKELVPVAELNSIISLCKLFDCLAKPDHGVSWRSFCCSVHVCLSCVNPAPPFEVFHSSLIDLSIHGPASSDP